MQNQLLEANKQLVDKNRELKEDIMILINFILGNRELKDRVRDIIKYYKNTKIQRNPMNPKNIK